MSLTFGKVAGGERSVDFLGFVDLMKRFYTEKVLKYEPNVGFTDFLAEVL